jgi:hypothetical protein
MTPIKGLVDCNSRFGSTICSQTAPGASAYRHNGFARYRPLVALVLALAPAFAAAQTVYKYQRPDGSTVYSDVPLSGAKLIGRFELVPAPPPQRPERGELPRRDPAKDPDELARQRVQDLDAAGAAIKAAEQSLKEALERLQAGVEPLPGERLGNVGGRSRLAPDYFERQSALASEVEAARARLDEAYRSRNELRN